MRCRKCNYRLWNLVSRKCPECGTAFVPSEYKFAANSVRFCCPNCGQAYYGTDENGHLVPVAFACASCGQSVHMDEMVLLPAEGVEEERTARETMPWLERRQRGFWRCWISTVGWALVKPIRLMRLVPMADPENAPWIFALFTQSFVAVAGLLPIILIGMITGGLAGGGVAAFVSMVPCCGSLVVWPIVTAVVLVLWSAVVHGLLRLTGSTAGPMDRTIQALCYSSGANVVSVTPCLGVYLGWIWWVISATFMVKEGQRVGGVRAVFAVATLPLLLAMGIMFGYGWLIFQGMTGVGPFAGMSSAAASGETEYVLQSVVTYAEDHSGAGPEHAIQLVVEDYVAGSDLVSFDSLTVAESVPVAGITLAQFEGVSPQLREKTAKAAVDGLPEGTIAHRLGDFVFTHDGIDFSKADPDLWVVIWSPDPDQNPRPQPDDLIVIGRAGGTTLQVPAAQLTNMLQSQNDRRADFGLPPLPNPLSVTHAKPAAAAEGPAETTLRP